MANRRGKKVVVVADFIFCPKSLRMVTAPMKLKDTYSWKESCDQPTKQIKKQRCHFADKGPYSQSYSFSSSHVQMWELDYKEGWALKNRCFWIVVLGKTPDSPLASKETKPVNPRGNQLWIIIGRTDADAELQYFGHLMRRADALEKTLMLGNTEGRRRGQ